MCFQGLYGTFQIDSVPQYDGSHHQVEAGCAVTLILKAPITQFAKPVEKDSTGQGILGFTFVEADLYPATQFNVLQPIQREQCALFPFREATPISFLA